MTAQTLLTWWHTLRHLRPVQWYARLWFRAHRPSVDRRAAPARRQVGRRIMPAKGRPASMLAPTRFSFIGIARDLDEMIGWDDARVPRLWRYNLHYFDDLVADDAGARRSWHRALVDRWIAQNPPPRGTAWEPYPTSLRIVNWVRWILAGNDATSAMLTSLAIQIRWLRGRLEHHLLGNHLWANAKALVFGGTFFDGCEADAWRNHGLRLLRREIAEQVLPDGGHFERSPMYHSIILVDLLELLELDGVFPDVLPANDVAIWRETAARMLSWLQTMSHPDGDIALFNDAALGIAMRTQDLLRFAEELGSPAVPPLRELAHLAPSGFVRADWDDATLIADVGEIGPSYIPGHAHADTLSFELSLGASRLIVDSGTSTYEAGVERLRQRSTAAHNCLEIDGRNSSEVWSSFRVGRRAHPCRLSIRRDDARVIVQCAHDGYRHLKGSVMVTRVWEASPRRLRILDRLEGRARTAVSRFHLHPAVRVERSGDGQGWFVLGSRRVAWKVIGGAVRLAPTTYHPRFNCALDSQCLEVVLSGSECTLDLLWE